MGSTVFDLKNDEVHEEKRSGCPFVVNDKLICAVDEKIKENHKFTINNLALELKQVLRTVIYKIVTEKLGRAIQNKRQIMLTKDAIFIHDNTRSHPAN